MSCRLCTELEQFLLSAQEPDPPALLAGLSERARHNRLQQREEKISKQQMLLNKHKKTCTDRADLATDHGAPLLHETRK